MTDRVERAGLKVAPELVEFVETEALPGTGVAPETFWAGLSRLVEDYGPRNRALLARREELQAQIDAWHLRNRNAPHDHAAYVRFLEEIGYLLPEGAAFEVETAGSTPRSPPSPDRSLSCRSPTRAMRSTPRTRAGGAFTTRSTAPTQWAATRLPAGTTGAMALG
jgi:malate synthase